MNKRVSIVAGIVLTIMIIFNFGASVFASSGSGLVLVGEGGNMTQAQVGITRTGEVSYASISVNSVYPDGNYSEDTYTRCKARLYHHTKGNTPVSDKYTLTEGTGYTQIKFYEGYLNIRSFDLCFSGNNPLYGAYIAYSYRGN